MEGESRTADFPTVVLTSDPASSVRDQIYMNYDYLHLRDGFVSKDPGLLVLGDLPQVQVSALGKYQ